MTEEAKQYDLFGEIEAAEHAAAERQSELHSWRESLRGPIVPAPWNMQGGTREGEKIQTWRCPACGRLELGSYLLFINHGVNPDAYAEADWARTPSCPKGHPGAADTSSPPRGG